MTRESKNEREIREKQKRAREFFHEENILQILACQFVTHDPILKSFGEIVDGLHLSWIGKCEPFLVEIGSLKFMRKIEEK